MKELSKERLSEIFEKICSHCPYLYKTSKKSYPIYTQAQQQIKQLISQKQEKSNNISPRLEYDDDGNVMQIGISGGTQRSESQQRQVGEEWIEEKVDKLGCLVEEYGLCPETFRGFIRSLIQEIQKPKERK